MRWADRPSTGGLVFSHEPPSQRLERIRRDLRSGLSLEERTTTGWKIEFTDFRSELESWRPTSSEEQVDFLHQKSGYTQYPDVSFGVENCAELVWSGSIAAAVFPPPDRPKNTWRHWQLEQNRC